jgi:guanine deaminase
MAWLDENTFPTEARHAQLPLARSHYSKLINRLLANGTTTAVYFASLNLAATQLFAGLLHEVWTPCTRFLPAD